MAEDKTNAEQLLTEIEDVLRTMPPRRELAFDTSETLSWFGRATAAVKQWDSLEVGRFENSRAIFMLDPNGTYGKVGFGNIMVILYQAQNDLRMRTAGPINIAVGQGRVFEYFDELRKLVELAAQDVFFVDPFLDAEFISRYLPYVRSGVTIRLLTGERKLATLLPAVDLFMQQNRQVINLRTVAAGLHDRYLFIDNASCYHSGASFKDGAKHAPSILTQITDAFDAVWKTYDAMWASAAIQR